MAADGLIRRSNCSGGGASTTEISYLVLSDPYIMRSVSVHGWSSGHSSQSLPYGRGFRNQMLDAIKDVSKSNEIGLFINSWFAHCQSERQDM
ncbi:hypothetical protein Syun_011917 [Stephania yunnanensis]|uniref:Pectin acetylesterase n=1 Tax=Stephania yunnanensis TaxID=152371 RepID=A0AAP0K0X2_9MAGN